VAVAVAVAVAAWLWQVQTAALVRQRVVEVVLMEVLEQ
jgi:hypothetical protein